MEPWPEFSSGTDTDLILIYFHILNKSSANRNLICNLKTSKALLKSQAHQGTSLFTSAATNQKGISKGWSRLKRSSGPISRGPGGNRVLYHCKYFTSDIILY